MNQSSQDYTTRELLAFYDRVKPVLSRWLAKPLWTASETAMLCAGYIPHDTSEREKSVAHYQPVSMQDGTPIDPHGYVPPDCELYSDYLRLLTGKEAAPPRDMVNLLRPASKKASMMNVGGRQRALVETPRAFHLGVLKELQWFFIIGNAVGLQVPALVPFGLLDELSGRLSGQSVSVSLIGRVQGQPGAISAWTGEEESGQSADGGLISETKLQAKQRKPREPQIPQVTSEKRGYHTTEEVAGLFNLLPDTLNKYARSGTRVEGFTPFKRHNGRSWQWRDDRQQAEYEASNNAGQSKRRPK